MTEKDLGFHFYDYSMPDGSKYYLACPGSGATDLSGVVRKLVSRTAFTGEESRLYFDDPYKMAEIRDHIVNLDLNLSVGWGKNTFFEQDINDLSNLQVPSWKELDDQFYIVPVNAGDSEDKEVLRGLMVKSFGVSPIDPDFDKTLRNPLNYNYLVKDRDYEKVVGAFVSRHLPQFKEVQLHSVAGRSNDIRVFRIKNKLPILVSAFLETVRLNYANQVEEDGEIKDIYIGVDKITFSASHVAYKYVELGFKKSGRVGMIIKSQV